MLNRSRIPIIKCPMPLSLLSRRRTMLLMMGMPLLMTPFSFALVSLEEYAMPPVLLRVDPRASRKRCSKAERR
jgi:hypothetical protein